MAWCEPYRVLLVDDEYLIRELLKKVVPWEREGFRVVAEAGSAEEALTLVGGNRYNLIVADICLPKMDGIDFAAQVRDLAPQVPVLILSGHDTTEFARRGIRAGVWDYILKPVVPEEIQAALQRVRRRLEALSAPPTGEAGEVPASPARNWGVLDEIRAWVYEHTADPALSLHGTAQEFLLNASYLSRRFKQAFGVGFVEYVLDQRIRHAMELARTSDLPAFEIGRAVGLPDAHYFSIAFKKVSGKTLTQYRVELTGTPFQPGTSS